MVRYLIDITHRGDSAAFEADLEKFKSALKNGTIKHTHQITYDAEYYILDEEDWAELYNHDGLSFDGLDALYEELRKKIPITMMEFSQVSFKIGSEVLDEVLECSEANREG